MRHPGPVVTINTQCHLQMTSNIDCSDNMGLALSLLSHDPG